ncbi:MAG: glycosyltransferase family 4 protein [Candidatus Muiribacteriota bacterium]
MRTIESFYPFMSGPAKEAYNISSRLEANRISSPIYTTFYKAEGEADDEIIENVNVKRYRASFSVMRYFFTKQMKKDLIQENFDIYHAHNYRSYQTDSAFKAARQNNKPFVISAHGSITGFKTSLKGFRKAPYYAYDFISGKKALKGADIIIVNSKSEFDEAIEYGIDEKKLRIMPFGIDVDKYKTQRKDKKGLTILFAGNISRNRNIEPIIKAMPDIDKRFSLRIVGPEMQSSATLKHGYIDELKNLAKENGVSERVEFAGAKYGTKLIDEYKKADVFAYTSLSENFGQTILEAGASGLPIIATPVGVAKDIINKKHLVDFDNPSQIAERINGLLELKKRQETGRKIQKYIEENFSWEEIMMEYEKMYLDLAKKYGLVK